jgi:chitosanase
MQRPFRNRIMRHVLALLVVTLATATPTLAQPYDGIDLSDPIKKDHAMQVVSSAENSSLNWRDQFAYIEDIGDGRGYTAGIIGFTTGTSDLLEIVRNYAADNPRNGLAAFLPALEAVDGTDSHDGLGDAFVAAWQAEAALPSFQAAQEAERDNVYFNPSVASAKEDGLGALGQFIYYDAAVVHGFEGSQQIRTRALAREKTPAAGGEEVAYLNAYLDERVIEMKKEAAHEDVSRIEAAQRVWLNDGNLNFTTPLVWSVYGDPFAIR